MVGFTFWLPCFVFSQAGAAVQFDGRFLHGKIAWFLPNILNWGRSFVSLLWEEKAGLRVAENSNKKVLYYSFSISPIMLSLSLYLPIMLSLSLYLPIMLSLSLYLPFTRSFETIFLNIKNALITLSLSLYIPLTFTFEALYYFVIKKCLR